jgi:D-arabinose 5-phosphate isomerase GutQ
VDALHGDIGLVGKGDILVMFSKSGTTKVIALNQVSVCEVREAIPGTQR